MRSRIRLDRVAGLAGALAGVVLLAGFLSPGPAIAAGPASATDPGGDTINRDTNAKLAAPAADIVSATVDSGAGGIILTFRTAQMANPATDPNWASGNTSASWQIDDNGDGKVDDTIGYSADPTAPGGIAGDLTHWAGPGVPPQHCSPPAAFDPVAGYTLTVDAGCIGKPAAISYRVQLTYDTSPGAKKPPLAYDVLPDQGMAGPVPIVVPAAPAPAPPPAAGAPAPPAPPAGAPPSSLPSSAPGAAPKPAAPPATRPAAKPVTPSTAAKRPAASTAQPPAAPSAAQGTAPVGALAATGADSRRLGAFGGLLLLLGGLTLIMRPPARRASSPSASCGR
jgi:hypothetical protein